MARRLLDFDPLTGMSVFFDCDNDKLRIVHSQDTKPALDFAKSIANDMDFSWKGIKNDSWHYAHLPHIIIMEMKDKHGVDINNMDHRQKFFELLNSEYKDFKYTTLNHTVRNG